VVVIKEDVTELDEELESGGISGEGVKNSGI